MREYEIAYTTFKEKIDALNEDVRNVIYSIRPTQEDIDAYVAQPIEHLQETIDTFELTPDTVHNAAVLMRVLLAKLENIQE